MTMDSLVNEIVKEVTAGGTGGKAPARDLQGYSESELRLLWRAERITEDQWKAELVARGASPQGAADQVAVQKNTGVSTAAATKGQLTAGEQSAVDALKSSLAASASATAAPAASGSSTAGAFSQPNTNPTTLADRMKQARATGSAPLVPEGSQPGGSVGPAGRTVDQVRGTEYKSDAERAWYLQQTGGKPTPSASASSAAGSSSRPSVSSGGGTGGSGSPAAAASPAIAGDYVWNNGRPYIAYQGQKYMLPPGVQEDDPRVVSLLQRLGGGDTSSSVVGNSRNDLFLRGATQMGNGVSLLNGTQYRAQSAVQGADGKWYPVGENGQPSGVGFSTQAAANAASPMRNAGPGMTSRLGNSPTAKAAGQGGFTQTIDPSKALFNTIGLDESIAAGATKGKQTGDIIGTMNRKGYQPLDITEGGISEGGGLTPVGNMMDPYSSFTGQLADRNTSIGMSSILGNSGHDTQYWLSQMSGLPPAEIAKLNINTPEKALQFEQAVSTLRQQGLMPNLASLYALNEPAAPGGAYGGSDLKWGSANGGASNTPYDQALAGFKDYALGSPDLQYLPDVMPSGMGSTQVGNVAYANSGVDEFGMPLTYADGGQFMTDEPIMGVGVRSQKPKFLMGEEGPEKVTIDPMNGGRERNQMHTMGQRPQRPQMGQGYRPDWQQMYQQFQSRMPEISQRIQQAFSQWQQGRNGIRPFATGGVIYAGGNKGWQQQNATPLRDEAGTVTDYGQQLGYKSDPLIYTGGAMGGENQNFMSPQASRTGQPVPASFELMGTAQKEQFANQGGRIGNARISGPISNTPVGYQPYGDTVLPVYDQLNPTDYGEEPIGYEYVPYNVGGTPGLIRVPQYNAAPGVDHRISQAERLKGLLNNNGVYSGGPGGRPEYGSINSRAAALAALYDLDPKAAMLYAAQGQGDGTTPWGQTPVPEGEGNNMPSSRDIQNQAYRERYYNVDAQNRRRAGMSPATVLDIPRQIWNGEGEPPWGRGEAPYQRFNGTVPEGYVLPFDYEPGSPWFNRDNQPMGHGRRGMPGGEQDVPWGQRPRSGWQGGPGWNGRRRPRRQGAPLGMGLVPQVAA